MSLCHISIVTAPIMLAALERNGRPSKSWWRTAPLRHALRKKRQQRGWNLMRLSMATGYCVTALGNWELGDRAPTAMQLRDWQEALGL